MELRVVEFTEDDIKKNDNAKAKPQVIAVTVMPDGSISHDRNDLPVENVAAVLSTLAAQIAPQVKLEPQLRPDYVSMLIELIPPAILAPGAMPQIKMDSNIKNDPAQLAALCMQVAMHQLGASRQLTAQLMQQLQQIQSGQAPPSPGIKIFDPTAR